MKVLVLIVTVLFVGTQIDGRAIEPSSASSQLDPDDEACIVELHLNREKMAGIDTTDGLPENNDEFAQLMECSGKRQGMFTSTNEVNYNSITEELLEVMRNDPESTPLVIKLYTEIVTNAVNHCKAKKISETSPGLNLIKSVNCVVKQLQEMTENL